MCIGCNEKSSKLTPDNFPTPKPTEVPTISENISVTLEFQVENLKEKKPKITGKTNLPDGMKLSVSIVGVGVAYKNQVVAVVKNGAFQTGNLPLKSGQYSAEITSVAAKLQSTEIQQIIGQSGEKLSGTSVKKDQTVGNIANGRLTFILK